KQWPSVYIFWSGVRPEASVKSYAYVPRVSLGQADGSTDTQRTGRSPRAIAPRNGRASPPRVLPPPSDATSTSASSPTSASWSRASSPATVGCSSAYVSPLPVQKCVPGAAASSSASASATDRLPGSPSPPARRPTDVAPLGLATTVAPSSSMIVFRYGLAS